MILTTSSSIEGRDISQYLHIVVGDKVVDTSGFRNPSSDDPEVSGEREVQRAREIALRELRQRAEELRADAVVGITVDHRMVGQENGLLLIAVAGTAVRLRFDS